MENQETDMQLLENETEISQIKSSKAPLIVYIFVFLFIAFTIYTSNSFLRFEIEKIEVDGIEKVYYHGIGSIIRLFFLLIVLFKIVKHVLYLRSFELIITNQRLIGKFGALSTTNIDLQLEEVEQLLYTKPLFGGSFNYGTIIYIEDDDKTKIRYVKHTSKVKKELLDAKTKKILNRW